MQVGIRVANSSEVKKEDGVNHVYVLAPASCGGMAVSRPLFSIEAVAGYVARLDVEISDIEVKILLEIASDHGLPAPKTERDLFLEGLYEDPSEEDFDDDVGEIDADMSWLKDDFVRPAGFDMMASLNKQITSKFFQVTRLNELLDASDQLAGNIFGNLAFARA